MGACVHDTQVGMDMSLTGLHDCMMRTQHLLVMILWVTEFLFLLQVQGRPAERQSGGS